MLFAGPACLFLKQLILLAFRYQLTDLHKLRQYEIRVMYPASVRVVRAFSSSLASAQLSQFRYTGNTQVPAVLSLRLLKGGRHVSKVQR